MKKSHNESIGELINKFELEEEKQDVETFNKLFFNCKLNGFEPHLSVAIGDYNKTRRAVTIGDNITLDHEFSLIDLTLSINKLIPFILKYKNGDIIGNFNSMLEAAEHLNIHYATFRNHVAKSKYVIEELAV